MSFRQQGTHLLDLDDLLGGTAEEAEQGLAEGLAQGINPFTKEEQVFAAKPATTRIRIRPLKKLKDAAL